MSLNDYGLNKHSARDEKFNEVYNNSKLENVLEEFRNYREDKEREIESLEQELEEFELKLCSLRSVNEINIDLREENERLKLRLSEVEHQNNEVRDEQNDEVRRLKEEICSLRSENEQLTEQLSEQRGNIKTIKSLEEKLAEKDEELTKLNYEQFTQLSEQRHNGTCSYLGDKNDLIVCPNSSSSTYTVEDQLELLTLLKLRNEEKLDIEGKLVGLASENESFKWKLSLLQRQFEDQTAEVEKLDAEIVSLTKRERNYSILEHKVEQQKNEIKHLECEIKSLLEENSRNKQKIEELKNNLSRKDTELEVISSLIKTKDSEFQSLKEDFDFIQQKYNSCSVTTANSQHI